MKNGFQKFWETVARKSNLEIHFNTKIRTVVRTGRKISICRWQEQYCREYDFVIWSPEMKSSLRVFKPWMKVEADLFRSMKSVYLITSLVDVRGGKGQFISVHFLWELEQTPVEVV